eukprot:TRINITY_DN151_c0_g2_i1.p1 TRINITY_DN151_c0_g2~~TRINITY_DN151_c0_g2_i1.p1  ORF type:complete len:361 (-),score=72.01 TRINITY_DN151_c0_g2_i1:58-1140(-)
MSSSSNSRVLSKCISYLNDEKQTPQNLIEELKRDMPAAELGSLLADAFWYFGIELQPTEVSQKKRLLSLISECISIGLVNNELLKERLEPELLEETGVIVSHKTFLKKIVRVNTKESYTQQKFNLLREESEGYAKLTVELNQGSGLNERTVDHIVQNIQSLIGYFDLDPNRVLDLVLEAFEHDPFNLQFLKILDLFKRSNLCQLLGFKFQFYQESEQKNPKSLYTVAAVLIKNKFLSLNEIYPHLKPEDADAKTQHDKEIEDAQSAAKRVGVISLASKEDKEKEKEKDRKDKKEQEVSIKTEDQSEVNNNDSKIEPDDVQMSNNNVKKEEGDDDKNLHQMDKDKDKVHDVQHQDINKELK